MKGSGEFAFFIVSICTATEVVAGLTKETYKTIGIFMKPFTFKKKCDVFVKFSRNSW